MQVKVTRLTDWQLVVDRARTTAWKDSLGHEPSHDFKMRLLMCRHSPLRVLRFLIEFKGIPYWLSTHLVRHGLSTHFVSSQRPDRSPTGADRHSLPQDALVNHDIELNAEEILHISKKRLCMQAASETRKAWQMVVDELKNIGETELAAFCKPECWWHGKGGSDKGYCPELKPCGMCPPKKMPGEEDSVLAKSESSLSKEDMLLLREMLHAFTWIGWGEIYGALGRSQAIIHHDILDDDPNCYSLNGNGERRRTRLPECLVGPMTELADYQASILEWRQKNFYERLQKMIEKYRTPENFNEDEQVAFPMQDKSLRANWDYLPNLPVETTLPNLD